MGTAVRYYKKFRQRNEEADKQGVKLMQGLGTPK
jgi:hypothetical protein